MRIVVHGLFIVFSCVCLVGCRHRLAQQPLTEQQQAWAEKMDDWNWKWRLPYNAPVRGTKTTGSAVAPAFPYADPVMVPADSASVALPDLSPIQSFPDASADIDDVVLVPMDGSPVETGNLGQVHEVVKGDTLSKISSRYYGNPNYWRRIYDANRGKIDSPDALKLGVKLDIPPAE